MRVRPDAADLLAIARGTYVEELLPHLPEEKRYAGFMVANAMAIARRELEYGDAPLLAELARLAELYGEAPPAVSGGAELARALAGYNRRLADDIRAGRFDAPGRKRESVRRHLYETTKERLRENNPKALKAEGLE